jgi:thiamine biosynthesis protein ThiS
MTTMLLALTLNGERRRLAAPTSVALLLSEIGMDRRKAAVERNARLVPRSRYEDTWLEDGDSLEVVQLFTATY